jgi:ribonucleotide monophosphatase NagD (HAD superfamily)
VSARISDLRTILFDMDGVLYLGDAPLPGVQATFDYLDSTGRKYCLITNNSTMTPGQYAEKLARMRVTVAEDLILTAGVATARYLSLEPAGAGLRHRRARASSCSRRTASSSTTARLATSASADRGLTTRS